MKNFVRFGAAALLILPAAWMVYLVAEHLWRLYTPPRAHSFGLHLRYGSARIYDPWSDAVVLACALTALVCGIAVARDSKKKLVVGIVGSAMIAIVAIGVVQAA